MLFLRRRAAAMSPREKRLALLFALLLSLAYCVLTFLYATLILVLCCFVGFYYSGQPLHARLGLNPRAGLSVPAAVRRWLWRLGVTGVSVFGQGKTRTVGSRAEPRQPEGHFRQRPGQAGVSRSEPVATDSLLFSPQDPFMASYIPNLQSPAVPGRRRDLKHPRELLRERLSRPNYGFRPITRRLSFSCREPVGTGWFAITPPRHYPLQQSGVSAVGVLPPVQWDGFRKKNILSLRNSPAVLSPVKVKISSPDHNIPSMDHLSCAEHSRTPQNPCSRESVLEVLKESHKREVEDEDRSLTAEQKSKRRRNDSGGSAHPAFEPLLPNGTPSQLVPKPGSLKRGMASVAEESITKRSRTSSISTGSGTHAPRGTQGTLRNAIQSSYSSSQGLSQKRSAPSSPLSSPGPSRCQTPEGVSKRPREDNGHSRSSASSVRSDQTASDKAPVSSKQPAVPNVPVTTSANSTGSGGKRKRKIQLVSSHRDDHISLPPPPELGYKITVKDLEEEKRAGISKIQKTLETPAPNPEKPVSPPATTSSQPVPSISSTTTATSTTLSSFLAAPLPTASNSAIPVINLDPSPGSSIGTASAAPNPLLEALKMKISTPASTKSAASITAAAVPASTTAVQPSSSDLKPSTTADAPQLPPASQSSPAGAEQASAFTQVLGQVSNAASSTPPVAGAGLFGLTTQISTSSTSSASNSITAPSSSSSEPVSNTNPLLVSGFKPIFSVTTTTSSSASSSSENKPPVQSFKPIFGDAPAASTFGQPSSLAATNPVSTVSSNTTSSRFGASTSSTTVAPSAFPGLTNTLTGSASTGSITTTQSAAQPAVKSLFGNWSTPSTTSTSTASVQAPNTGSTFQFGAAPSTTTTAAPAATPAAATTISSQAPFAFGATQPDPQATTQKVFAFGQPAPTQNTNSTSFGGFAMANTASTTAAATTQSTFTFGKAAFEAPAAQSSFGSSAAPPKPFTFRSSGASSTPASNPTPAPFTFGASAATTAATFGTPTKPAFGASSSGFAFAGTTAPSPAPSALPSFGAATQTQGAPSSTFTFGGAAPQPTPSGPAQPATSGFNFGAGISGPQFGTPVPNNPAAPQMGNFNFGAAAATDKPTFGTSTPNFGYATGVIPFGSPTTPVQGFNAVQFGSAATPSFSIGAGSKPSGARQRLQARRQHNRKK